MASPRLTCGCPRRSFRLAAQPIYNDENLNKINRVTKPAKNSAQQTKPVAALMKSGYCKQTIVQKQRKPSGRTILGELPINPETKKSTRVLVAEKQCDRPVRKILGELPINTKSDKPAFQDFVNCKPRNRQRLAPASQIETKKCKQDESNTEEPTKKFSSNHLTKQLCEKENIAEVETSQPVIASLNQSSVESIISPSKVKAGFSTYRYEVGLELQELPYKKEFLHIPEYMEEIHDYLFKKEKHYLLGKHYLKCSLLTPRMRATLVDWLVIVGSRFEIVNETLHVAVQILDNFLNTRNTLTRSVLQLVGITSLFIASKYEETYPKYIYEFAEVTGNTWSSQDIVEMEEDILKTLGFDISPPSTLIFFRRGFKIATNSTKIIYNYKDLYFTGSFILELALVDYEACAFCSSQVGAAALALSMMINRIDLRITEMWDETLQKHVRYSISQLKVAILTLSNILLRAFNHPKEIMSVRQKFSGRMHHNISMSTIVNPKRWEVSVFNQLYCL